MSTSSADVHNRELLHYGFGPEAMKKVKVCTKCAAKSDSSEHFCTKCGQHLPKQTLYDRYKRIHQYCDNCDTVIAKDSIYCPQCGIRVKPKKED